MPQNKARIVSVKTQLAKNLRHETIITKILSEKGRRLSLSGHAGWYAWFRLSNAMFLMKLQRRTIQI